MSHSRTITALLLGVSSYLVSFEGSANAYGVISLGYSDSSVGKVSDQSVGYSAALGYQIHRQWYVEAGYMDLLDSRDDNQFASATGPYLSILGKAGNEQGELFYKLGIASIDKSEGYVPQDGMCGNASETASWCEFDERIVAGIIGLGFDFFLSPNSMLRAEYVYLGGESDFSSNTVNIGFRYNF